KRFRRVIIGKWASAFGLAQHARFPPGSPFHSHHNLRRFADSKRMRRAANHDFDSTISASQGVYPRGWFNGRSAYLPWPHEHEFIATPLRIRFPAGSEEAAPRDSQTPKSDPSSALS